MDSITSSSLLLQLQPLRGMQTAYARKVKLHYFNERVQFWTDAAKPLQIPG